MLVSSSESELDMLDYGKREKIWQVGPSQAGGYAQNASSLRYVLAFHFLDVVTRPWQLFIP